MNNLNSDAPTVEGWENGFYHLTYYLQVNGHAKVHYWSLGKNSAKKQRKNQG